VEWGPPSKRQRGGESADVEEGETIADVEEGEAIADRPQCRICFGTDNNEENGPLFRPCSCRGTMAWVHMECLDHWRRESTNPHSFYHCDQCHFEYRFRRVFVAYGGGVDRFTLARLLTSRWAVHGLSLIILIGLIFVGGFVGKLTTPEKTWWDVFACFNLEHLVFGSAVTGLGSLVGWLASTVGGAPIRFLDVLHLHGGGGGSGDSIGKVLLAIAIVVGLMVALSWIFSRVDNYAQRTVRRVQQVVLDVGETPHAEVKGEDETPSRPHTS